MTPLRPPLAAIPGALQLRALKVSAVLDASQLPPITATHPKAEPVRILIEIPNPEPGRAPFTIATRFNAKTYRRILAQVDKGGQGNAIAILQGRMITAGELLEA